jgi:hypothetical protein
VVFARRQDRIEEARAHRPAGVPGAGGAYRAGTDGDRD